MFGKLYDDDWCIVAYNSNGTIAEKQYNMTKTLAKIECDKLEQAGLKCYLFRKGEEVPKMN